MTLRRLNIALILALGVSAGPVWAGQQAKPSKIFISREACADLVAHVPSADVTYQPGISADGEAVAPADVASQQFPIGADGALGVDITVQAGSARRGAVQAVPGGGGLPAQLGQEVWIGRADIVGDQVYWNGQPIDPSLESQLAQACAQDRPPPP